MESGDRVRRGGGSGEEAVRRGAGGREGRGEIPVQEGLAVVVVGRFVGSSVRRRGGGGHVDGFGSCDKTLVCDGRGR